MLLYFMVDWLRDAEIPQPDDPYGEETTPRRRIREAFQRDPDATCAAYQIGRDDLRALGSVSPQLLALMPSIARNFIDSFGAESSLLWPGPILTVAALTPDLVAKNTEVELAITIDVDAPDMYDGRDYSVTVVFENSLGERVVGAPILPIAIPQSPVARVTFGCRALFPTSGAYSGTVTVTASGTNGQSYSKPARFELGKLNVSA